MAVFAIIAADNADKVKAAVTAQYGANHYEFSPTSWFVSDTGSSKDVSEKLGIIGGKLGSRAVVTRVTAYSGWAPSALWGFMTTEAVANG